MKWEGGTFPYRVFGGVISADKDNGGFLNVLAGGIHHGLTIPSEDALPHTDRRVVDVPPAVPGA